MLAGGLLVVALPWLQRWLYWFPEPAHRLFWSGDFVELNAHRGWFYHQLAQGKLALWDPLMATGQPVLSYLFDIFNPVALLSVFFLEDGLLRSDFAQVMLIVYCSLAGLGAFLLGLQLRLGRSAATVMGLVMGGMGVMTAHSIHATMISTIAWSPYVFLFLQRAREGSRLLNGAWAGIFFGLCFTGGMPQVFYYLMFALGLYVVYWAVLDWRLGGWSLVWGQGWQAYLGLGLASLLMGLPNLAHEFMSTLGDPVLVHDITALAGKDRLLFTQENSGQLGLLAYFLLPRYMEPFQEAVMYVGILPLLLALAAVFWVRRPGAGYWKLLCLAGLVLLLGGQMGLHKVLLDLLPGYGLFRAPVRWGFLLHLGLLVLAGYGLAWLLGRAGPEELRPLRRVLAVVCTLLLGLVLVLLILGNLGVPGHNLHNMLPMLGEFLWLLLMAAALWWAVARLAQGAARRLPALLLVFLAALDLGFYYAPLSVDNPKAYGNDPSRLSREQYQRAALWGRLSHQPPLPTRILLSRANEDTRYLSDFYTFRVNLVNSPGGYMDRRLPLGYWQIWWQRQASPRFLDLLSAGLVDNSSPLRRNRRDHWSLVGYSQSAVPLPAPGTVGGLELRARVLFARNLAPGAVLASVALLRQGAVVASWPLRLGQELGPGQAVRLALPRPVAADEVILASAHPRALVEVQSLSADGRRLSDGVTLEPLGHGFSRNRRALPMVYFVSRAAVIEPDWEYLRVLASMDPSRGLIFRRAPAGWRPPQGLTPQAGGRVQVLSWRDQEARLKVSARRDGYLVMSQSAFQGWRAHLDGRRTPVHKAYGFLVAVTVPAGEHELRLDYDEPLVKAGLAGPPLALLGLAVWSLWGWRRRAQGPRSRARDR
ncbi:MAG: hypothetical protein C4525_11115 [Desulfarculus sp.]|nr:MAG: hypothetical protein C4525_11115 [Desulfarculus sp.]